MRVCVCVCVCVCACVCVPVHSPSRLNELRACQILCEFLEDGCKVLTMTTPAAVELYQPACLRRCHGTDDLVGMETDHTHQRVLEETTGGRGVGSGGGGGGGGRCGCRREKG